MAKISASGLVLIVSTLIAALPLRAAEIPVPGRKQLRACPAFADVDFRALRSQKGAPRSGWREAMDARHARTRGPFGPFEPPGDASLVLRLWAGPGETQSTPTATSSIVWLGADDRWHFNRVDHASARPVPPRPFPPAGGQGAIRDWTAEEVERARRDLSEGMLAKELAEEIEATLADPCFKLQPDSMPLDVPVRKGKAPRAPCPGIIGATVEMRWADGRRRDVTETCGGFYASRIIYAVMYARADR